MYRKFGKRRFDLAITVPALILLSPLIAALALLVRLKLGAPVLFRQQRPGLYGRPAALPKRVGLLSNRPVTMIAEAVKIADSLSFAGVPTAERLCSHIQPGASASVRIEGFRAMAKRAARKLRSYLENRILGYYHACMYSFANRSFYRKR
jgi:hypothetical protein